MESNVCPLLGLIDERGAYLTYPSYENRCYAASPHQPIPLNEQTFFCLGGNNERCPRYLAYQQQEDQLEQPGREQVESPAGSAGPSAEPQPASPWQPVAAVEEEAGVEEVEVADGWGLEEEGWEDLEVDLPPPPSPPDYGGWSPPGEDGPSRRPVWPLVLAAGTLVVVLMFCGLLSAAWLGVQSLSSRLALNPTGTPVIETETRQPGSGLITATLPSGGVIVIVATPTPGQTDTVGPGLQATPTPTSTEMATPTWTPFPTPTSFLPTPTPVTGFTPLATPTPRATPTFAPTTGFTPFATPTPRVTPTQAPTTSFVTPTPSLEPFTISFLATPTAINAGQEVTLSWTVRGVREVYLDGDPVTGPTGSRRVKPTTTTTYVLRVIRSDGSVQEEKQTVTVTMPTATSTPTATPTATPTPFYRISFAENRFDALIDGTGCQTGNGCSVFQIQIANNGNRPSSYSFEKIESLPFGWSSFFCWGSNCEFGNAPRSRTLDAGALETASLNFLLPARPQDGSTGSVTVKGICNTCGQAVYEQDFFILIELPQNTPTPTPTGNPTATPTWTPTPTPTSSVSRGVDVSADPSFEATTDGSGCNQGDGCEVFTITVRNTGSGQDNYRARLVETAPRSGWNANICDNSTCFPADETNSRSLNPGAAENLTVKLRLTTTPNPGDAIDFNVQATMINEGPQDTVSLRIRYTD